MSPTLASRFRTLRAQRKSIGDLLTFGAPGSDGGPVRTSDLSPRTLRPAPGKCRCLFA
ncbi:protein of unknown function [Methylocella tundrae]|uniref:Uncharacterized protein n=1 Tax=Methylocella tundrae TaxID=227605 RepID=A0A4U8Z695_METTU|nr:protein of unknown function [Methylocella tundrae]